MVCSCVAVRQAVEAGKDPRGGGVPTFEQAASTVIALHAEGWRDRGRSEAQWQALLRDYADTSVPREVAEACLAHIVKGVEGAYQRSDLLAARTHTMQHWAQYLTETPTSV